MTAFTDLIRPARERMGLSQTAAARLAGLPLRTYQGYERGESDPPTERAAAIRSALDMGEAAATKQDPAPESRPRVSPNAYRKEVGAAAGPVILFTVGGSAGFTTEGTWVQVGTPPDLPLDLRALDLATR